MTLTEVYTGLKKAGYPVAYRAFKAATEPPFVCYLFIGSADVMADNSNYHGMSDLHVELYTSEKDPTAEAAVETQLKALGLAWSKFEAFIDAEDMYQILYQTRTS